MIPRRIWVNLAAFGLLFLVLCAWALANVLHLDAVERPYRILASFESSPGLRPNVEVSYHGVQIGSVDAIELRTGQVDVALDIDRGVQLPTGLTAAVRRKSAVGEPYVALEPPTGYDGGGPYIDPGDDYAIGVESTTVPLAYGELFTAIDDLVKAVPADDLVTVLHELATALGGRGQQLRTIIEGSADLTSTLAERSDVLDQLAGELTSLTHAISERRDSIGAGFDNVAALTETLAAASDDIDTLLSTAPAFGAQVSTLLDQIVDELGCTFADVGDLFGKIGTPERVAQLLLLMANAGPARDAFNASVVQPGEGGADGYYLGGSIVPEAPSTATPPLYDPRPQLPEPPVLDGCVAPGPAGVGTAGDDGSAGPGEGGTTQPTSGHEVSAPPSDAEPAVPASSDEDAESEAFPLAAVVAAFALALVAAALVALRPWRFLAMLRRGGGDGGSAG